ncbi:glycosyltransferase family 4 protein [Thioclava sp.]|uniref:glycosyltransferase family 4 protein n=1 Tax=Thioclava sp. TaxID=1933450 RepID=UPI003AA86D3B
MHVIVTVNSAWNILNFRRPMVEALISAGHEVSVLAPRDDSCAALQALGCRYLPLDMNVKGLNPIDDLRLMARYRRIFRRERPDVVLSYTIKNNLFGALAARMTGTPFLPNVTGLGTAFLSGGALQRLAEGLYRAAFSRLPVVFFQNSDDRDLFVARSLVRPDQARLLPGSGIDLNRFAPADWPRAGAQPAFLMIARLLRDKGVLEYVEAARSIRAEYPQVKFRLLGATGSENRTAIDAPTVQSWVDEGVIDYLGTTDDVRPEIAQAHCVVLPSYREGAPRTLIEAAAMARPVIATDVPGCRAVLDADLSGYLCAPRDGASLAEAMRRFLALSPQAQQAMGQAGRDKMVREFDQAIVVSRYHDAIRELTGGR